MIEEEKEPSVFHNRKEIIFSLRLMNKPRNKELLTFLQKENIFKNKNNNLYNHYVSSTEENTPFLRLINQIVQYNTNKNTLKKNEIKALRLKNSTNH